MSEDFDRGGRREGCRHDQRRARLVVRAREKTTVWGRRQVLECWDCGRRWTA